MIDVFVVKNLILFVPEKSFHLNSVNNFERSLFDAHSFIPSNISVYIQKVLWPGLKVLLPAS